MPNLKVETELMANLCHTHDIIKINVNYLSCFLFLIITNVHSIFSTCLSINISSMLLISEMEKNRTFYNTGNV